MKPGIYKMSFRGLTYKEAWRFGGEPFKFLFAVILKAIAWKGAKIRLPTYASERVCDLCEIPSAHYQIFLEETKSAIDLGYKKGSFYTFTEYLDPNITDGFCYISLHEDRKRSVFIGGVRNKLIGNTCQLAVSGSIKTTESDDIEFAGHKFHFDSPPPSIKIQISKNSIKGIDNAMKDYMEKHEALNFKDFKDLREHINKVSDRVYDSRVNRGLYIYSSS